MDDDIQWKISKNSKDVLRELAKEKTEIANKSIMIERRHLCYKHIENIGDDCVIDPFIKCGGFVDISNYGMDINFEHSIDKKVSSIRLQICTY